MNVRFFFAIAALVTLPAAAQDMQTLYEENGAEWSKYAGMKDGCSGTYSRDEIKLEAQRGAEVISPGMWAWITGAQAETAERLSTAWTLSYSAGLLKPECLQADWLVSNYRALVDRARESL